MPDIGRSWPLWEVLSLVLFVGGIGLYFSLLKMGRYRAIPTEMYALWSLALALAIGLSIEGATRLRLGIAGAEVVVAAVGVLWLHYFSRNPDKPILVQVGDRFPDVVLPASDGTLFESSALRGKEPVLYLFYRGDW